MVTAVVCESCHFLVQLQNQTQPQGIIGIKLFEVAGLVGGPGGMWSLWRDLFTRRNYDCHPDNVMQKKHINAPAKIVFNLTL